MKTTRGSSPTAGKGASLARFGLWIAIGLTGMLSYVQAHRDSYSFSRIEALGNPAPGVGFHVFDFEPSGLNNRGDALFGTNLGTNADPTTEGFGEGVFLLHAGQVLELARSGGNAPGGGGFNGLPLALLSFTALNNPGDAVFTFQLSPFSLPLGINCGVYRYSHSSRTVTPVVRPGVTSAPGGAVFAGVFFGNSRNNGGDLILHGIIATDKGIHLPDEDYVGLGSGVFKADRHDHITSVVSPGDATPRGGAFDFATAGWINNAGDVAFAAHVAGEESRIEGYPPQAVFMSALTGVYVEEASTGKITSIAHPGDPAPGGGVFRQALAPVINGRGDIAFAGDLSSPPHANQVLGVYLHSGGLTIPVARPGDPMPGGGTFVSASLVGWANSSK